MEKEKEKENNAVETKKDKVSKKKVQTSVQEKMQTIDSLTEQQKKSCMKFVGHYHDLFPITGSELKAKEINFIDKAFLNKDLSSSAMSGKVMTIVSKNDSVKSCFVHLLKKLPSLSTARYISLYDIIDIQFGKHPKYTSIRDIHAPIILIYVENVTNRLKDEYLLRAVDYWCKKGFTVWIYFKGMTVEWTTHFEKTKNFAVSNRFLSLDMNNNKQAFGITEPIKDLDNSQEK